MKKAGLQQNWAVDSAAIEDWHTGNRPNPRAVAIMEKYKLAYDNRARQITEDDFYYFDYIFGMDNFNVEDLKGLKPRGSKAKIILLNDFDPDNAGIIRDPYCDHDSRGFEQCYQQARRCCENFLSQLAIAK